MQEQSQNDQVYSKRGSEEVVNSHTWVGAEVLMPRSDENLCIQKKTFNSSGGPTKDDDAK